MRPRCGRSVLGSVPAIPENRLPAPSALSAPCTTRKSVARGVRLETCWIAMPSPMVSTAPTMVTTANAGRSAQKSVSKDRSNPGQSDTGKPTQRAADTALVS